MEKLEKEKLKKEKEKEKLENYYTYLQTNIKLIENSFTEKYAEKFPLLNLTKGAIVGFEAIIRAIYIKDKLIESEMINEENPEKVLIMDFDKENYLFNHTLKAKTSVKALIVYIQNNINYDIYYELKRIFNHQYERLIEEISNSEKRFKSSQLKLDYDNDDKYKVLAIKTGVILTKNIETKIKERLDNFFIQRVDNSKVNINGIPNLYQNKQELKIQEKQSLSSLHRVDSNNLSGMIVNNKSSIVKEKNILNRLCIEGIKIGANNEIIGKKKSKYYFQEYLKNNVNAIMKSVNFQDLKEKEEITNKIINKQNQKIDKKALIIKDYSKRNIINREIIYKKHYSLQKLNKDNISQNDYKQLTDFLKNTNNLTKEEIEKKNLIIKENSVNIEIYNQLLYSQYVENLNNGLNFKNEKFKNAFYNTVLNKITGSILGDKMIDKKMEIVPEKQLNKTFNFINKNRISMIEKSGNDLKEPKVINMKSSFNVKKVKNNENINNLSHIFKGNLLNENNLNKSHNFNNKISVSLNKSEVKIESNVYNSESNKNFVMNDFVTNTLKRCTDYNRNARNKSALEKNDESSTFFISTNKSNILKINESPFPIIKNFNKFEDNKDFNMVNSSSINDLNNVNIINNTSNLSYLNNASNSNINEKSNDMNLFKDLKNSLKNKNKKSSNSISKSANFDTGIFDIPFIHSLKK